MTKPVTLVLFLALTAGTCHNPNNIVDTSCVANTTVCRNERPYVCAGGQWRPVGDTTCTAVGAVCCSTALNVHACVRPSSCVAGDGGAL